MLVVLNPAAGRAEAAASWGPVERALVEAGALTVTVRLTAELADARRWGRDAAHEGFDVVLVGGGDGTVAAVASGVVQGCGLPLGILPTGTGNGLARTLRLPASPLAAIRAMRTGRETRVDALEVVSHDRLALVFAGAGLDAEINRDADAPRKRRFGTLAYAGATVRNLVGRRNRRVELTLDGQVENVDAHAVSVFNAGVIEIAGMEFGPPADPHDGLLDVAVFRTPGPFRASGQVLRLLLGRPKQAELLVAKHVRIASDPPMLVHVDGEVVGSTPLEVRTRRGVLRFLADAAYTGETVR